MPDEPLINMLDLHNVRLCYGQQTIVDNVSLHLADGEIGCLLGASGSGKSTILRAIAGFHGISAGAISLFGNVLDDGGNLVSPDKRHIGMIFQDFALFPHLTVSENIAFGLHKSEKYQRKTLQLERVEAMLQLVGLSDFGARRIHSLSGGQQQRIALARALAPEPGLLLLDEPFSSLDTELRKDLSYQIRDILKQQNIGAMLVTHDQHEAFAFADKIAVLGEGAIQQWDTPYNLYHKPNNRFVANFVGENCFVVGQVASEYEIITALGTLEKPNHGLNNFEQIEILLRPDDVVHDDMSPLKAKILKREFRGAHILFTLSLPGLATTEDIFYCLANSHHNHMPGDSIGIRLDTEHLIIFKS